MGREEHLVELVDDGGRVLGETTVAAAHQPPGRLHRAFSVLLVDPAGRVLLQQRAAVKTRFPLRWANSCCGHPLPGQSLTDAANRRLTEELGLGPVDLTEVVRVFVCPAGIGIGCSHGLSNSECPSTPTARASIPALIVKIE